MTAEYDSVTAECASVTGDAGRPGSPLVLSVDSLEREKASIGIQKGGSDLASHQEQPGLNVVLGVLI